VTTRPASIKRYANRKLYDAAARRHVTLEDLGRRVADGEDIMVEDQETGEDLTNLVLAQVVLESVKDRTTNIPRQVLTRLVRFASGKVPRGRRPSLATRAREEAERIVARLLARQKLSLEEAMGLRQEIAHSVQRVAGEAQRGLEQALRGVFEHTEREGGLTPSLLALKERLLTLETYLEAPGRSAPRRPGTAKRS
jgi:polyhydroxyalkanoate synthesis repressor PhaR